MFRCDCCGSEFEETERIKNPLVWGGYEEVCPRCSADLNQISSVFQCDECGGYYTRDELADTEDAVICKECFYGKAVDAVS